VKPDSLEEVYSSKSDDELLALAEEQASLREEAKQVKVRSCRREREDCIQGEPDPDNCSHHVAQPEYILLKSPSE